MNTEENPTTLVWTRPDGTVFRGEKDIVMAAFWKAGRVGAIRDAAAPTPVAPTPTVSSSFTELVVDEKKAKAITEREAAIRKLGFALPQPWFAAGTRMLAIGNAAYKAEHKKWAEGEVASVGMERVAAHIEAEDRRDFVVRLGDLHMDADGCFGRKGGPFRQIEWGAWDKIYGALQGVGVLPDGAKLLRQLEPATRAAVVNERIDALNPDKEVKVGVRRAKGGGWTIFRVVSPRYPTDGQANTILRALAARMKGLDFRGTVIYDPASTSVRFNMAHMVDPVSLDPAVGDIFRAGVKGSTNDAGMGRFRITPFAGRIICVNCTMMDGYAPGYSRIHRGSMEEAMDAASKVTGKAVAALPLFASDWKVARATAVEKVVWNDIVGATAAKRVVDVPTALTALVNTGQIDHGTKRDALVQHMLNAHKNEPGQGTVADVLNAVTRAAHEAMFNDIQRDKLERQAGALLPVLVGAVAQA